MSNTNRTKGHNAEREYRNKFRALGYQNCETSRYASRKHDDCKVDLVYLPFNVQIKAGKQRSMNPSKVLSDMKQAIEEGFPGDNHEANKIKVLIHRKDGKRGKKRDEFDDLVTLTWEDFAKLTKMIDL